MVSWDILPEKLTNIPWKFPNGCVQMIHFLFKETNGRSPILRSTFVHFQGVYMDVSKNSGFPPQIIHFNRVFHHKPFILGVFPLILETPIYRSFKSGIFQPQNLSFRLKKTFTSWETKQSHFWKLCSVLTILFKPLGLEQNPPFFATEWGPPTENEVWELEFYCFTQPKKTMLHHD